MKVNTSQEKAKRIQPGNAPKTPFLSMSPRNDNAHKMLAQNTMKRQQTLENIDGAKVLRGKNVEDQGFTNIFADDTCSTKHYSKRQNHLSTENLRVSFKGKQNPSKNVRESENICSSDNNKTPPNSLCDRRISITKSVSNLGKPNDDKIYIKLDKLSKEMENGEESHQNQQLLKKIQEAKNFNDRIEEENIHLRLEKLYFSSESRELFAIKKEIGEVKKKIEKLRAEAVKMSENYEDYYSTKKDSYLQRKPSQATPYAPKQRVSDFMPRTQSNLQGQHSSSIMGEYESPQSAYQPLSPTLTKSRIQQKNRPKRMIHQASEQRFQNFQIPSYRIYEDKDPNIIRIQIRK